MKRFWITLILLILTGMAISLYAADTYYVGYVSDVTCGTSGVDIKGTNVAKNPGRHAISCLQNPSCMASGYGAFIKNTKGDYDFYKFDSQTSDICRDTIVKPAKNNYGIKVLINGKIEKGNIIRAKSIKAVS